MFPNKSLDVRPGYPAGGDLIWPSAWLRLDTATYRLHLKHFGAACDRACNRQNQLFGRGPIEKSTGVYNRNLQQPGLWKSMLRLVTDCRAMRPTASGSSMCVPRAPPAPTPYTPEIHPPQKKALIEAPAFSTTLGRRAAFR